MDFTYSTVNVKAELLSIIEAGLKKHDYRGVRVVKGDPASPAELPCIAINRVDDGESSQTIADANGHTYNKDTREYVEFRGTFFSEAMECRVWHTNADEREDLYLLVKAVLFANRANLIEKGLLNIDMRGGRDEQDNTMTNAPFPLYWGTITMSYLNPLDVAITSIVETITDFIDEGTVR